MTLPHVIYLATNYLYGNHRKAINNALLMINKADLKADTERHLVTLRVGCLHSDLAVSVLL